MRHLAATFINRSDADLAASQLRSHGVECWMESDDAGGMYPSLRPVRLFVDAEDLEAARVFLKEPALESVFPEDAPADAIQRPSPTPSFLKFGGGLLIGILLGVLWHVLWVKYFQDWGLHKYQQKGREDVWRNGEWIESRYDRNGDNRFDAWARPESAEEDNNFDGRPDVVSVTSPSGVSLSARIDTDFNGIPDATITYEHGVTKQADYQPNGTNAVLVRFLYRNGVMIEELRDLDGDGRFDISVKYDPFSRPISTNELGTALKR